MFTGIIQAMGTVRSVTGGSAGARLALDAPDLYRPIADGASICVNGVCLTVTQSDNTRIEFDVVPETLMRSTLNALKPGDRVNLEPSLRAGDRMDGHIVQGHVDGIARITEIQKGNNGYVIGFAPDNALVPYIIPKGSIAIDGISLTIAEVKDGTFTIAVIPTTLDWTTLGTARTGDRVNIETDIVARTIVTTLQRMQDSPSGITMEMLREHGFAEWQHG
jgi:riboflavin synthase